MAHKAKNSKASGKAGPGRSIMSLGVFLHGSSQCLPTSLFSMEFGRKKRAFYPPSSSCKSSGTIRIGPGLIMCPTAARECTIQIGHMVSLETSPAPPPTKYQLCTLKVTPVWWIGGRANLLRTRPCANAKRRHYRWVQNLTICRLFF